MFTMDQVVKIQPLSPGQAPRIQSERDQDDHADCGLPHSRSPSGTQADRSHIKTKWGGPSETIVDKQTTGAWIVHHGRKVAADVRGAAEFSAIDFAAKAASLLARLAESNQTTIKRTQVEAVAKVGGLNPKTELAVCLAELEKRRLIQRSTTGDVAVLGVTGGTALMHAADIFEESDPQPLERAAIDLAEQASPANLAPPPRTSEGAQDGVSRNGSAENPGDEASDAKSEGRLL